MWVVVCVMCRILLLLPSKFPYLPHILIENSHIYPIFCYSIFPYFPYFIVIWQYDPWCSYGFLPLIIHPTRVVENQEPSLIDNIFTNNVSDDIISGNIYLTLSEHFSQFASVKHEKLDSKIQHIPKRLFKIF